MRMSCQTEHVRVWASAGATAMRAAPKARMVMRIEITPSFGRDERSHASRSRVSSPASRPDDADGDAQLVARVGPHAFDRTERVVWIKRLFRREINAVGGLGVVE